MPSFLERLHWEQQRIAGLIFDRSLSTVGLLARHYRGVGLGFRIKNGARTGELCLRIYVARKLSPMMLPPSHLMQGTLFGIPTDIAEVGRFVAYAQPAPAIAPATAAPGAAIQISPPYQDTGPGTLGAVLVDAAGARYALSANHVIARNGLPTGARQFSIVDVGNTPFVVSPPLLIGSEVTYAPLFDGCQVDCAMVKAAPGVALVQQFPAPLSNFGPPVAVDFARPAAKFGYATQLKFGKIADHTADIEIDFGPVLGELRVAQTILVEDDPPNPQTINFAQPGDSGSLAFQQVDGAWSPLGIVMGGAERNLNIAASPQEQYAAVCPYGAVLTALSAHAPGLQLA
jgi:hypothetical protein